MRSHPRTPSRRGIESRRRRLVRAVTVATGGVLALTLSGCSDTIENGFLPSHPGVTDHTDRIITLWNGSWIAALATGVLVWGLIIWAMVVYRRRKDDAELPPQVRYHLPLEIMYTMVPLMMVGVLFAYTYQDQTVLTSTETKPDITIGVVGKQWAWDFNYLDQDVYESGVQAQENGTNTPREQIPTLYLPVGKRVQFDLSARDVIHSFWIPAFLMKMDTIPGVNNKFQLTPEEVGTYLGKCAELCGEYHSEMLFNVKVVPQAEFDAHIASLKAAGQTGSLPTNLGRSDTPTREFSGSEADQ